MEQTANCRKEVRLMPFDLHIPENSQRGQAIQRPAVQRQLTPEEILNRIIDDGIQSQAKFDQDVANGQDAEESADPQNLAEFLGGFIGCIHGS
jgi:hypothetical protein